MVKKPLIELISVYWKEGTERLILLINLIWAYWKASQQTLYMDRGNPQIFNLIITFAFATSLSSSEKKWFSLS